MNNFPETLPVISALFQSWPLQTLAVWSLVTLVSAFLGSFLPSYFKKKAENLATHEDIDKLVDQVSAVTKTTKEIEAKISGDLWDRQKRWELKREVLFDAMRRLPELEDALLSVDSVLRTENQNRKPGDPEWYEAKAERMERWSKATTAFDETRLFVSVVCGREANDAFDEVGMFANSVAAEITKNDLEIYRKSYPELCKKILRLKAAVRKELGE